jgi:hypothetical protein
MASIASYNQIAIAGLVDAYGSVPYVGETVSWNLPSMIGRQDSAVFGFATDPTGTYIIQTPAYVAVDADETQWATSGGTFTHRTDESTGKLGLKQTNGAAGVSTATFTPAIGPRGDDIGFAPRIFRGAPASGVAVSAASFSFYMELNSGHAPGTTGLRIAVEAGNPIRLEVSVDDLNWVTVDIASTLGDSEAYLSSRGRYMVVDVVPMTDRSWWDGLPQSSTTGGQPADFVAISINGGDAVLVWKQDQALFPSGTLKITATGGQWGVDYIQRWYVPQASMGLPQQTRYKPFQGDPASIFSGYIPYHGAVTLTGTLTAINKGYALLQVQAPPENIDATTGYTLDTVMLVSAALDWPHIETQANALPASSYFEMCSYHIEHEFDQVNFLRRSKAVVTLEDTQNLLTPGVGITPSVRAAAIDIGNVDVATGVNDTTRQITGIVDGEISWTWEGMRKYVTFTVYDKLRDDIPIMFDLPYDGQCHYYAIRRLAYKLGITDQYMQNFPTCGRDSDCPHYHLPRGTTTEPALAFPPNMMVVQAMLQIRRLAGEPDFATQTVLPMYLFCDNYGNLEYFPAPVGIVATWLNPDLTIGSQSVSVDKAYSTVPTFSGGEPNLNEFVGGLTSNVNLAGVRNKIILEGESPVNGSLLVAYFSNPALGGGSYGNPNQFGNAGIDKPYVDISKLYTTQEALNVAIQIAAVQMSFPRIGTTFGAWLQPKIFPFMVVTAQDFGTQGTTQPVAYCVVKQTHTYSQLGGQMSAETFTTCRLLGQAA